MNKLKFILLSCCLPFLLKVGVSNAGSDSISVVEAETVVGESLNEVGVVRPVESIPIYSSDPVINIVGGNESPVGARPYQVSLRQNNSHICGGALLNQQWVVTAAHCVNGTSTSGYSVRVGVRDISSSNEGQVISLAQVIPHPDYTGSGNDIALLKLASNAPANLTPLQLPSQSIMDTAGSPGSIVTVSGWGALSQGGGGPDIMHEVDVPIVSNQTCNAPESYNGQITGEMICAGLAEGGKDSCQGDSGGPLAAELDGAFYSIGVVSWGEGCALPNKYGVYTRTFSHVSWINGHTGGGSSSGGSSSGGSSSGGSSSGGSSSGGLSNGQTVTGLAATTGNDVSYYIDVPAGATDLAISISGGTGDADLYVKKGSVPTDSDYDCRPYVGGNAETCGAGGTALPTSAGRFHIRVKAYSSFTGVSLTAAYQGGGSSSGGSSSGGSSSGGSSSGGSSSGGSLQNGSPITVSGAQSEESFYTMDVPSGATNLKFETSGGTGDVDLYVRFGSQPTTSSYDCRPYANGNAETCDINPAQAGTYHIMLHGYSSYSNASLEGSYTP